LAKAIQNDHNAPVSASASGSALNLTALIGGTAGNYAVSCSVTFDSTDFSSASFAIACPSALTGGK
jgi:phage tail sheath gpL-like